jgi:cytochrome c553
MSLNKLTAGMSLVLAGLLWSSTPAPMLAQAGSSDSAPVATPPQLPWAFPVSAPGAAHPADDMVRHVPGSSASYTRAQIEDPFAPPDWFPTDHPSMPDVVAHGRRPSIQACARCHLANGFGHPQSANLAGLPSSYIAQQMYDFRSGARKNSAIMTLFAKAMTDEEIKAAGDYFASVKPQRWTRVVEAANVPRVMSAAATFAC